MAELILRKAYQATDILKAVTCMVLRHSFAVHCLENGASTREVQETLGHESVETTLRYQRCILPEAAESPLDLLRQEQAASPASDASADHTQPRDTSLSPAENLFSEPVSVATAQLPFRNETGLSAISLAVDFYRLLKTHLFCLSRASRGHFLCSRRVTICPG